MPIAISIDSSSRFSRARVTGRVTTEDLRRHIRNLPQVPGFRPDMDQLFDVSGVTAIGISTGELRDFASSIGRGRGIRLAVVAPSDLGFGLSRMFELLRTEDSTNTIRVFRSEDEAVAWLTAPKNSAEDPAPRRTSYWRN